MDINEANQYLADAFTDSHDLSREIRLLDLSIESLRTEAPQSPTVDTALLLLEVYRGLVDCRQNDLQWHLTQVQEWLKPENNVANS